MVKHQRIEIFGTKIDSVKILFPTNVLTVFGECLRTTGQSMNTNFKLRN
jgi:hypothetical protein